MGIERYALRWAAPWRAAMGARGGRARGGTGSSADIPLRSSAQPGLRASQGVRTPSIRAQRERRFSNRENRKGALSAQWYALKGSRPRRVGGAFILSLLDTNPA